MRIFSFTESRRTSFRSRLPLIRDKAWRERPMDLATAATLSPARSRALMAEVSSEVRRERGIASLHVFCSRCASCTTHHRSCQPSSPAGFRSSEEEPARGNRTAGEDSFWRQGSAASPPTASLRPGRQASVWRETKRVERLETLGFAKACVRFRTDRRARPECPKGKESREGRRDG